jgi:hypothetical protein
MGIIGIIYKEIAPRLRGVFRAKAADVSLKDRIDEAKREAIDKARLIKPYPCGAHSREPRKCSEHRDDQKVAAA